MQRNLILTDIMKTGDHLRLERFIALHSIPNQTFDTTSEFSLLQNYDLESYDRKFAVIDFQNSNSSLQDNKEFMNELDKRCKLLHSLGFLFIKANPWESYANMLENRCYPEIDVRSIKWTGDVSWFWFYMYDKHMKSNFKFDHTNKKFDFLYLNKLPRPHRLSLYNKLKDKGVLEKSLYTFTMLDDPKRLPAEYELPGIRPEDYPRWGKDQDIYELPYNHTACSIVSETNDNDHDVFMTEKIWKPIIAQHLFVVHGNYLYLQKLREMGFKTFSSHFDESYDLERHKDRRQRKIVQTCLDITKKNWKDIYLQTQALRQHNYDTFFDKHKLSLQVNATLDLFLEFADRS